MGSLDPKTLFSDAKNVFVDENTDGNELVGEYILLDGVKEAYKRVTASLQKPLKIILLYGEPGSGKTAMLRRLYANLKDSDKNVLYYPIPTFAKINELKRVLAEYSNLTPMGDPTFYEIMELFKEKFEKESFIILLDEAQLYNDIEMEYIRLLSDTKIFKFLVALHKISDEHLTAKSHFQSRIWEQIELIPLSMEEFRFFIERKLIGQNLNHIISMLPQKAYKMIHGFTRGNIREGMKFLYRLFDFYEFLEKERPSDVDYKKIKIRHIEMVAIDGNYINV